MKKILFNLMSQISGQAYTPGWEEKISSIIFAGVGLLLVLILFISLFIKYFNNDFKIKKLVIFYFIFLCIIILGKFILFRFSVGYVSDRLLFYALPSPKIKNIIWLIFSLFIFLFFIKFREKIEKFKLIRFLTVLSCVFFLFVVSVAGIREGVKSISDPMTRTQWEYTGNIKLISDTKNFLQNYIVLIPDLAIHSTTHPPGYSLLVYYFSKIVNNSIFGISLLVILMAVFTIFPIYYLLRNFFDELLTRKLLQIYIFIPSIVFMSGTSLEAFFVVIVWLTITLLYTGWNRSFFLSVLGGLSGGIALFSNFLFILLAPFFLGLIYYVWRKTEIEKRIYFLFNLLSSILFFLLFFIIIWKWTGYSILENFFIAHSMNQEIVVSNFQSIKFYFIFLIMNILSFTFGFGIINILYLLKNKKEIFIKNKPEMYIGFFQVLFLLVIGIFQGELIRLWMFVVPFFLFPISIIVNKMSNTKFNLVLSLLFLQIIFVQVLFYTYW